jgi:hypothetical protein
LESTKAELASSGEYWCLSFAALRRCLNILNIN